MAAAVDRAEGEGPDLYSKMKSLQRQVEFFDIQVRLTA